MNPLTINQPIPFGRHRDGTTAAALLRRKSFVIVGEPDSGKSVGLHCFNAGLMRCPDALVWHIDLGGAGLAAPWIGPWLDGDMERPVIDWVAPNVEEAVAMCETLIQIIVGRRAVYRAMMRRANTDVLPVTPAVPAIQLLMDETAEGVGISGSPALQQRIVRINQLGRFVAVRAGLAVLRATTDAIPKAAMTSIGARIGMQVADDSELSYLMGWKLKFNPQDYPYPGCGLWRPSNAGPPPARFRFYDLSNPRSIEQIALACEQWRPELDDLSLGCVQPELREAYRTRWERTRPALAGEEGGVPATPMPTVAAAAGQPRTPPQPPVDAARLDDKIARARRVIAAERRKAAIDVDTEWARLAEQLDDDRSGGGEGWADGRPAGGRPDAQTRTLQIVAEFQPDGISGPKIIEALRAEGYTAGRSTIYGWLNAHCTDGGYGAWHPKPGSGQ